MKLRWKGCTDDTWQALESLAHDVTLVLAHSIAAPALKALCEEEMQGLAVTICRLEAAVVAILNNWNLTEENRDLDDASKIRTKVNTHKHINLQRILEEQIDFQHFNKLEKLIFPSQTQTNKIRTFFYANHIQNRQT